MAECTLSAYSLCVLWHKDFGGGVCIKALSPITGAAIDLVVRLHRPMTFRPKLPTLLNRWPLVARYPNWSLLPRGELKAMDREVQGILQIGARQPHSERNRCHRVQWLGASLCLEDQPPFLQPPFLQPESGTLPGRSSAKIRQVENAELAGGWGNKIFPSPPNFPIREEGQKIQRGWLLRALLTFGMVRAIETHQSAFSPFSFAQSRHNWTRLDSWVSFQTSGSPTSPTRPKLLILTVCRC